MFVTMGVRLAFPPFSFDRDERVLRRGGTVVPLPPKAAQALGLLLDEPGALVEKEALRDALWPDGFVEDGNLTQTVYVIRRALDPSGDGRGYVETIPRRGYRFVPPVVVEESGPPSRVAAFAFGVRALALATLITVAFGGVSVGGVASRPAPRLTGEAAREYALGRYTWNRRTEAGMRASIRHFGRVVALAPQEAVGYAGLADVYGEVGDWGFSAIAPAPLAYRRAEQYAREALRRDPRSGEGFTTLGLIALQRDGDLERAERAIRTAIAFRPDHAPAYELLGILRLYRGDAGDARTVLHRAIELDPLSPMNLVWYAKALYYAHAFADARTALRQLSDLDALNFGGMEMLALTDVELGLRSEARDALAKLHPAAHKQLYGAMLTAYVDVRTGRTPSALPDLRPRASMHVDTTTAAAVCLAVGRRADALAWLALGLRDPDTRKMRALLPLDPRFAPLIGDQRFRSLVAG